MAEPIPPITVTASWDSALEFTCQAGKHEVGIDGATYSAPSPMQLFAVAISGCMAVDIVHIIQKSRRKVTALEARFIGERATDNPRRFVRIGLKFAITTDAEPGQVERAIDLSRETYCSVWASMREDIPLDVTFVIDPPD